MIARPARPAQGIAAARAEGRSQTGQRAGKTRSSAASAQLDEHAAQDARPGAACSSAGTGRSAPAIGAAGAAASQRCGQSKRVPELQRAAVLLERLARLAAALEDGAEEGVDDGQVGRPHLDLLELVRGLVEHLQLEVDAAQRHGQRQVVGRPLDRRPVERDHPARPALLAVGALQPREQRAGRLRLGGALPGAHGLAVLAGRLVGVAQRQGGRQRSRGRPGAALRKCGTAAAASPGASSARPSS